ncbi:hypothetical protein BJ165DRAFT_1527185 [Panaeolus papilionaceus]|nr:hypothetical protein BJ165DRAFT_1527185 [Panaeolus papilionaceus]
MELSILGEVSVEPCESVSRDPLWCILILGPTGAGKSRASVYGLPFIEALAGEGQSLGLSKDQLAGFTQDVTGYKVKNAIVKWRSLTFTLCLIDTPGFSDTKISELEIITKVKKWMTDQHVGRLYGVLYFSPITDTRAPGSKRRTIKMIQSLLDDKAFNCVSIVTTMWDKVSDGQPKKRAEANFVQLRDDIWKGPVSKGARVSRSYNNYESAIQILRDNINSGGYNQFPLTDHTLVLATNPKHHSAPFLYQELLDRVTNARQEMESLQQEKTQLISDPDPQLESVVYAKLPEVKDDLSKFLGQLIDFGTPPPGFEGALERCVYQDLLDHVNDARGEQAALTQALAHLHTNPDCVREATLTQQLDLIKQELAQRVTTLLEHGNPPKGYEKGLEHALELTHSTAPQGNTSKQPLASADRREGSVTSQVSLRDRVKKVFRPLMDKLQFRSRREGRP